MHDDRSKLNAHRSWRTPIGLAGNVLVAVVILALTIGNAMSGRWFYVGLGALVLVGFGVVPAYAAWKDGALLGGATRPPDKDT